MELVECYDKCRDLHSHVRHHLHTPRTAARPSSLRSVPSGFPITMAKTQNAAATQAKSIMARLKKGEIMRTIIDMPTEYKMLESTTVVGSSESGSAWIHCVEEERLDMGGSMQTSRS